MTAAETPAEKWSSSWQREEGDPGFHYPEVHPSLQAHWHRIAPLERSSGHRVLVPLSGKSLDLTFIASQHDVSDVLGVEAVKQAIDEYKAENPSLNMAWTSSGSLDACVGKQPETGTRVVQLLGDFLQLTADSTGGTFHACWDRAALVAVDLESREAYADTIARLLHVGGKCLLTVFNRVAGSEDAISRGPPHGVSEETVHRLYEQRGFEISKLASDDRTDKPIKPGWEVTWREHGLTKMLEETYLMTKKS